MVLTAAAAVVVGLLYPLVTGERMGGGGEPPDLSKVTRCVAVFVGICQASAVSFLSVGWGESNISVYACILVAIVSGML